MVVNSSDFGSLSSCLAGLAGLLAVAVIGTMVPEAVCAAAGAVAKLHANPSRAIFLGKRMNISIHLNPVHAGIFYHRLWF